MSTESAGGRYLAEFVGGPLDGEFEERALVRGATEARFARVAAIDGLESLFWYDRIDEREANGRLHARFRFDAGDSDPVEYDVFDDE